MDKSVFNFAKLTEEEVGHLEWVLNSPSFDKVFKPYLLRMVDSLQMKQLDRSQARKDEWPDDFLAGYIVGIKGLLAFFDSIILSTNQARAIASQEMTPDQEYDKLRAMGFIKGSGQAVDAKELELAEDY